jgi:hypothetical protein
MPESFTSSTTREHCYEWTIQRQVVFPEKLVAGQLWPDSCCERVAYVGRRYAVSLKKGLFERENAEEAVNDAAHRLHPAFAPCPDLGRDEVDDRDAQFLQLPGHAEMEVGGIGEDGNVGPAFGGGADQGAEAAPDAGDVPEHFHKSHDRQIFRTDHGLHAGFPEMRSGAPEEVDPWPAAVEFAY